MIEKQGKGADIVVIEMQGVYGDNVPQKVVAFFSIRWKELIR
jgi:hypothetical protein